MIGKVKSVVDEAAFKLRFLQVHAAYKRVFESDDGKLILKHLNEKFGGDTYVDGNPGLTLVNQGQRRVVISIAKFVSRNPVELLNKIEKELQE